MKLPLVKVAQALVSVTLFAAASDLSAAAAQNGYSHRAAPHRTHYRNDSSDVTVRKSVPRDSYAGAPDAFHGPAAIITAPIYIAGTFVSMPFRALEVVFPPHANDPRVLIGAPVHLAGQIATFPFSTVNGAFGARPAYY